MRVYDRSTITIQSIQVLRQRQFITAISTDVVMLGKTITQFIVMNEFFTGNFGNVHASIGHRRSTPKLRRRISQNLDSDLMFATIWTAVMSNS